MIAIGSALGLQNTVTRGIVSARRQAGSVVLLQTDAAINPGNSGGPLLDRSGVVLGVTTLKMGGQAEGLGFAVAADHVTALVDGRASAMVAAAAGGGGARSAGPSRPLPATELPGFGAERFGVPTRAAPRASQAFDRDMASAGAAGGAGGRLLAALHRGMRDRGRGRRGDRSWFGVGRRAASTTSGATANCPNWLNDLRLDESRVRRRRCARPATPRAAPACTRARCARSAARYKLDWSGFDR